MAETQKPYAVISHDGWGSTSVGEFESLEEAQALFRALCVDRWFVSDGSVKGVSIVERCSGDTVDSFAFERV